jgi:Flp pilus assembly pilin Flp
MNHLIRKAINKSKTKKVVVALILFMLSIVMIAYAVEVAPPVKGIYDADRGTTIDGTFSGQVGGKPLYHQLICIIKSSSSVYSTVDRNPWNFSVTVTLNRNVADSYLTATLTYTDDSGILRAEHKDLHNNGDSWIFSVTAMKLGQTVMNQNLAQVILGNLEVHAGEKQWFATAYDVMFRAEPR